MELYLEVTADTNDGDYISERNKISLEAIESIKPLLEAIEMKNGSWRTFDMADSSLEKQYPNIDSKILELFSAYVPNGDYGVHSIEKVVVLEISKETRLL